MSLETIPHTEAYEFDGLLIDAPTAPDHVVADNFAAFLGRVALQGSGTALYLRTGEYLSSEDIEQLERFYALLRTHYGIAEDQPVFPKKERAPEIAPIEPDPEVERAA